MKRFTVIAALLCASVMLMGSGCNSTPTNGTPAPAVVTPKDPAQTLFALEVALTTATNALVQLHQAGVITGDRYTTAVAIEHQASTALKDVRAALLVKDATKIQQAMNVLSVLVGQLETFTQNKPAS